MLKTEIKAKFAGFTDKGKAMLEQGGVLYGLNYNGNVTKKLREVKGKDRLFTCSISNGKPWITDVEPLESPAEKPKEGTGDE